MHYYYPTTYPCVVQDSAIRVYRLLDADGEIEVEVGQRVAAEDIVAVGRGRETSIMLDGAVELGVNPGDVAKHLKVSVGTRVKAGDVVGHSGSMVRKRELKVPETGTIAEIDTRSGHIRITPESGHGQLRAYVSGFVEEVHGRRGVTVATAGTRINGIWGLGGEAVGVVQVLSAGHNEDLPAEELNVRASLAVVVAGRTASAEALRRAALAGVRAVVLGSIDQAELRLFLESMKRPGPRWYVSAPEWRMPSPDIPLPFVLVVTEGFGRIPMARDAFAALKEVDGREASVSGWTRLRNGMVRPEIIVPTTIRSESRAQEPPVADVREGSRVRLVDPDHLGQCGVAAGPVSLRPATDGLMRDMVDVELDGGGRWLVPIQNVEVLG